MFKILACLLVSIEVFAMIPFDNYTRMCEGRVNCQFIYNHQLLAGSNINYKMIERYPPTWPANTNRNLSFCWAQSHAQAFTFKVWISWFFNRPYPQTTFQKISELSFIKSVLTVTNTTCKAPQLTNLSRDYVSHLPYQFVAPSITTSQKIFTINKIPVDEAAIFSWCNMTYLNKFNTDGAVEGRDVFTFPGYDNLQYFSNWNFETFVLYGVNRGIAIVGLPHDYDMTSSLTLYNNGFYKLSGPRQFYQPANVVGYYRPPNNNTLYFIVYAFGAYNPEVNYLFVDARIISLPGWLTFIQDYRYPA